MHTYTASDDAFIVGAPTYKIMQQSTLPAFLKIMDGYGDYSRADAVFKMHGGGLCYMRTATEPDSIVGITNVRGIWIDEAGKVSRYFWENVVARSAFMDCQIDLTSSPYALNWLFKDIVKPKMKDPACLPHIKLIQAASWENPLMPMTTIDQARLTMPKQRFNALFGGQWERMTGLVYDCFDEDENQCDAFALPAGTRITGGIDWGYTEPFVLKVRAITPDGRHFGIAEFYKSGLTIDDITDILERMIRVYGITTVYCGPDRPENIEACNRRSHREKLGCSFLPANNAKRLGLDTHYSLVKTRRIKYFKDLNPHTLDEYEGYHYPSEDDAEDLDPDDKVKEELPVEQDDHTMDAERYCSIMTATHGAAKHIPVETNDGPPKIERDHEKRAKQLMRGNKGWRNTENW